MAKLKELLQQLTLNEKEARVFLALVKLGSAAASAIAHEANLTRTHVYDLVVDLIERGLVSVVESRGVKRYEATDHAGLIAYVSREQERLNKLGKNLEQWGSEFNALRLGRASKTRVRFFDGPDGIHAIYAEIKRDMAKVTAPAELLTIFSPAAVERALPGWFESGEYIEVPPAIVKRGIVCQSELLQKYLANIKTSPAQHFYKLWPGNLGEFPVDTICWPHKITYIDLAGHPSGIIIENEALVKTFTMWFNQLWASLP
ncbi:MAG: hypothetical protein HYV42_03610 [Candidatus Magasanikbacteria bacterium]|nr:hypothetical protein [Candidatus Magasanikbacteria bacterium]